MPLDRPGRMRARFAPDLLLPPPFRAISLREAGDAFAHATKIAADAGAGALVHVGRFDLAEFAVVLEPEEPLRAVRRTLYAGLAALGDALAVHAPPEKPISFEWPDAIRVDGGLVGGARLGWPNGAEEDEVPAWLVFGAMIRTAPPGEEEPGLYPLAASLHAEGFDLDGGRLLEGFARHLMARLDTWQQDGFAEVAKDYLARLDANSDVRYAIDENGDLLMLRAGCAVERRALRPKLAAPTWFDPASGAPRL